MTLVCGLRIRLVTMLLVLSVYTITVSMITMVRMLLQVAGMVTDQVTVLGRGSADSTEFRVSSLHQLRR
jgi:hypothetical protein